MKRNHSPDLTSSRKKDAGGKSRWSSDEEEDGDTQYPGGRVKESVRTANEELTSGSKDQFIHNSSVDRPPEGIASEPGPIGSEKHSVSSGHTISRQLSLHNPLFHGCRSVDNYQRLNYISSGTYGVVYRAQDIQTGEIVALKQIKFDKTEAKTGFPITALRETNILLALQHPNIVRVKEMVVGSSIDKVFMAMEYLENDLRHCMDSMSQPFTVAESKALMVQILSAVDHMHERWYIHRDLKTSNILFGNTGNVVVCDFGMARKYGSPLIPYTFNVITLWYRPLELLLGTKVYSTAVDMWSIGCIFAEILTRKPLFPGEGEVDQITKICRTLGAPTENNFPGFSKLPLSNQISWKAPARGRLRELFPPTSFSGGVVLSESGFDLLSRMLIYDPKSRISAHDALHHPWFNETPLACPRELMPKFKSRHEVSIMSES